MHKRALNYFLSIFLSGFPFFAKNELEYEAELKPFDLDQEMISFILGHYQYWFLSKAENFDFKPSE